MLSSELKYEVFAIALPEDSPPQTPPLWGLPPVTLLQAAADCSTQAKGLVSPFQRRASVCTCLAHQLQALGGPSQLDPPLLNLHLGPSTALHCGPQQAVDQSRRLCPLLPGPVTLMGLCLDMPR